MLLRLVLVGVVITGFAVEARQVEAAPAIGAVPVAWRGGYRSRGGYYRGSQRYSPRRAAGRSSPLDYSPSSQPPSTRNHQWNRYPNQPYYLRGERKSLLILP